MKTALLFLIASIISTNAITQTSQEKIQERIAYCNAILPDTLASKIANEFEMLEARFIMEGLLKDNSGKSYSAVFQRIAKENQTDFFPRFKSKLLDNQDKTVLQACLFKFLTPNQLSQVKNEYVEAGANILKPYGANVTPSAVAQRIIDNISPKDFDLAYFRFTSLLTFYKLANPERLNITLDLPIASNKSNESGQRNVDILDITLNEKNEIFIAGQAYSIDQVPSGLVDFMQGNMRNKAIAVTPSRKASYRILSDLLDRIRERYLVLKDKRSLQEFKLGYSELNQDQVREIDEAIPISIIMNEAE